jgi:2'-5' RNA ligase
VLYSSRNSVGGGPYVIEAAYDLDGANGDDDDFSDYDFEEAFGVKD